MNRFLRPVFSSIPLAAVFFILVPLAHAAAPETGGLDNLGSFLLKIVYFIDVYVVPVIFALAFIVFIWGIYSTFIAGAANDEKRQEGQKILMYGLIGFVIMFSVWGLINLLVGTLGFDRNTRPPLPVFGAPESAQTQTSGNPFQTDKTTKNVGDSCSPSSSCGSGMECISGTCHPFGDIVAPPASGGGSVSKLKCPPNTTYVANYGIDGTPECVAISGSNSAPSGSSTTLKCPPNTTYVANYGVDGTPKCVPN